MSFGVAFHGPFCRTDTFTVNSLNETRRFSSKIAGDVNTQESLNPQSVKALRQLKLPFDGIEGTMFGV
jgi:hypothetical protein